MEISLQSTKKWIKAGAFVPPAARLVCYGKIGQPSAVSQIIVNSAANKRLLRNKRHVTLLYDPNMRYIGLKPVARKQPNSYLVSKVGNGRAFKISATSFVRQHGIANISSDWGELTDYKGTLIFPIVDPTFFEGIDQFQEWIGVSDMPIQK